MCCLASLGRLRERGDGLARLLAENRILKMRIAELESGLTILRSTRENVPPRRRRHYKPDERFQIIHHMKTFLLTVEQTARRFLITPQTIFNWLAELRQDPEKRTVGSLLQPIPPLRRYDNVVRRLVRQMKHFRFCGNRQIAATLVAIGWKLDRRSVGRFCQESIHPAPPPDPARQATAEKRRSTTVRGRYPNHLWMIDITRIPLFVPFLHLHLAVVLDAYSRMPLAGRVFVFEPSAQAMLGLLLAAVARHGKPKHFVSDQGAPFKSGLFRGALEALGIRQRFGALYQHGSIALIERFWKSIKTDLRLASIRPWNVRDLERRLAPALVRYSYCRPHSALDDRMPAELFFGLPDQRPRLNTAPRGHPDDPERDCPVEIVFLDPNNRALPILVPRAA